MGFSHTGTGEITQVEIVAADGEYSKENEVTRPRDARHLGEVMGEIAGASVPDAPFGPSQSQFSSSEFV